MSHHTPCCTYLRKRCKDAIGEHVERTRHHEPGAKDAAANGDSHGEVRRDADDQHPEVAQRCTRQELHQPEEHELCKVELKLDHEVRNDRADQCLQHDPGDLDVLHGLHPGQHGVQLAGPLPPHDWPLHDKRRDDHLHGGELVAMCMLRP